MVRRKPESREQAKPVRPAREGPLKPPPTIADLKRDGLTGVFVTCTFCQRSKPLAWDDLGVADEALFPTVADRRSFTCSGCGGRGVSIMPDWRGYKPAGGGG